MRPHGRLYRNQFWITRNGGDSAALVASGLFGQECYVHPLSGTVLVKFSSYPSTKDIWPRSANEWHVFEQVISQLSKQ